MRASSLRGFSSAGSAESYLGSVKKGTLEGFITQRSAAQKIPKGFLVFRDTGANNFESLTGCGCCFHSPCALAGATGGFCSF
jgi:hypothetical protein